VRAGFPRRAPINRPATVGPQRPATKAVRPSPALFRASRASDYPTGETRGRISFDARRHLAACHPYFYLEDRLAGRVLLAAVLAIELATIGINVLINQWNSAFYDAIQKRNWDVFVWQLEYYKMLAITFVILRTYQTYFQQWLLIRWRQWMTKQYLERWISDPNQYRMQLLGDAADNPDQRISEDIKSFIDLTL
jgi:ABC-type uncharacterized transport system fused permease/ATPase subunit